LSALVFWAGAPDYLSGALHPDDYLSLFLWRSLLILFFLLCFAILALLRFLPQGILDHLPNKNLMTNVKAQMTNEIQNPNIKF
jgi:hypothetical protein